MSFEKASGTATGLLVRLTTAPCGCGPRSGRDVTAEYPCGHLQSLDHHVVLDGGPSYRLSGVPSFSQMNRAATPC